MGVRKYHTSLLANYRPITLQLSLRKILEENVENHLDVLICKTYGSTNMDFAIKNLRHIHS